MRIPEAVPVTSRCQGCTMERSDTSRSTLRTGVLRVEQRDFGGAAQSMLRCTIRSSHWPGVPAQRRRLAGTTIGVYWPFRAGAAASHIGASCTQGSPRRSAMFASHIAIGRSIPTIVKGDSMTTITFNRTCLPPLACVVRMAWLGDAATIVNDKQLSARSAIAAAPNTLGAYSDAAVQCPTARRAPYTRAAWSHRAPPVYASESARLAMARACKASDRASA